MLKQKSKTTHPKVKGCDPLVHQGKLLHETAELEGYNVSEALLTDVHSSLWTGPSGFHLEVVTSLGDGLTDEEHDYQGLVNEPQTLVWLQGGVPGSIVPGNITCLDLLSSWGF